MHCDYEDEKVPNDGDGVNQAECEEQQVLQFWVGGQSREDKFSQQSVVFCFWSLCCLHLGGIKWTDCQMTSHCTNITVLQPVTQVRSLLGIPGEPLDQRVQL